MFYKIYVFYMKRRYVLMCAKMIKSMYGTHDVNEFSESEDNT